MCSEQPAQPHMSAPEEESTGYQGGGRRAILKLPPCFWLGLATGWIEVPTAGCEVFPVASLNPVN